MEAAKSKWQIPPRALDSERILEEYYDKLHQWGVVLSRGDRTLAQEIVHDLCLHFIVAKPDLSAVANLDGYLYTCLRHIYLSALARSSREALQTVNVADFDSVQFALNAYFSDSLLDRQNELRRICNYAVWRKGSSKSASYFLLLFFHGYTRREVAEIAQLPLAAIYNKLKVAREELTAHLKASIRPRIASRDVPPNPDLHVSTVSSAVLFRELRAIIFEARSSECLPEETLLAQYRTTIPKPVPCGLLSHIVSCERCLSLLDRHFRRPTSEDREPPGSPSDRERGEFETAGHDAPGYHAMMSSLRRERGRIYEHRPQTLSIAINGKIVAFHDVKSERSTLASRAERPETVQFVEVFTDQQIRLALLPIEGLPPGGWHAHTQAVTLSDGRLLELTVSFDGQGLHSEVTYLDPALAAVRAEDDQDENSLACEADLALSSSPALQGRSESKSITNWIARAIHILTPRTALAWAVVLVAMVGSAGYLACRYAQPSLDALTILNDSVKTEAAEAKGATEHQVLQLDALGESGQTVWQGTVDVWQEPSGGRTMRRLYNAQHQFIAADWRGQDGENNSFEAPAGGTASEADHRVAESGFWKVDVSARGFKEIAAQHIEIRTVSNNYELTDSGPSSGPFHLVSAMLVLNHKLHLVGETLHMTDSYEFTEARFVEASDNHLPAASVPESVFDPSDLGSRMHSDNFGSSVRERFGRPLTGTDPRIVQTEIAVLYRLNQLGADVGVPIEISRTANGHIRVAGTVTTEDLKREIVTALEIVPDRQLLEIHLVTERSIRLPISASRLASPPTDVYNVAPVEPPANSALRKYFAANGLVGKQIDSAVTQFSRDALDHAQRALQNAYALDRLGSSFSAKELRSMGPIAQQQWSAMAARHSSALETELDDLKHQLAPLNLAGHPVSSRRQFCKVDNPADFAGCARRLLLQTQDLNRAVGDAFSLGLTGATLEKGDDLIDAASDSIPLNDAKQLAEFTSHLANTNDSANSGVERYSRQ
jgi:DNA-directed RNA polymerase specialized sigma24 family protein